MGPGALRRAYRDMTLTLSDTVVYRKNVYANTAAESCYICLKGLEIEEEVVILRCACPYWTHEACLGKSVFETCRCPTCQMSVDLLDDEISLAKAATEGDIAAVRRLLEQGTQHCPRGPVASAPLLQAAGQGHPAIVQLPLENGASVSEHDRYQRKALYWASIGGHKSAAEELLSRGADTSNTDEKGQTLLHSLLVAIGYSFLQEFRWIYFVPAHGRMK